MTLVENAIKASITKLIGERALLRENKYGFCKWKLSLTSLLELFEKANKHADRGELVDIIHQTFKKALIKFLTKGL